MPEPISPPPSTATLFTRLGIKPLSVTPGTYSRLKDNKLINLHGDISYHDGKI